MIDSRCHKIWDSIKTHTRYPWSSLKSEMESRSNCIFKNAYIWEIPLPYREYGKVFAKPVTGIWYYWWNSHTLEPLSKSESTAVIRRIFKKTIKDTKKQPHYTKQPLYSQIPNICLLLITSINIVYIVCLRIWWYAFKGIVILLNYTIFDSHIRCIKYENLYHKSWK